MENIMVWQILNGLNADSWTDMVSWVTSRNYTFQNYDNPIFIWIYSDGQKRSISTSNVTLNDLKRTCCSRISHTRYIPNSVMNISIAKNCLIIALKNPSSCKHPSKIPKSQVDKMKAEEILYLWQRFCMCMCVVRACPS